MPEIFVGLGSNAEPHRALRGAVAALAERFGAIRCSSVYRSAAVGVPAADYLNMVVAFASALPVAALVAELRALEDRAGRSRADAAICVLDLDLLLYGWRVCAAERLPRPGLFAAPFVLVPLAELAPGLTHPVTGEACLAAANRLPAAAFIEVTPCA